MNQEITLEQLYEMQKVLDARIIEEKGLQGKDLLPNTVLALQVEIAELANEWRGFKHWSNDQQPRTKVEVMCSTCNGTSDENWEASMQELSEGRDSYGFEPCADCNATGKLGFRNPLLEEYVDCLHFFLSIARQIGLSARKLDSYRLPELGTDTSKAITKLINKIGAVSLKPERKEDPLLIAWTIFIKLGLERFDLTWRQIKAAYMEKNKVNHERQSNGY